MLEHVVKVPRRWFQSPRYVLNDFARLGRAFGRRYKNSLRLVRQRRSPRGVLA